MSDTPFPSPEMPPLMTAPKARDIARFLKGAALGLRELGAVGEARTAERQSEWWLSYALVLDRTHPDETRS